MSFCVDCKAAGLTVQGTRKVGGQGLLLLARAQVLSDRRNAATGESVGCGADDTNFEDGGKDGNDKESGL